MPDSRPRRCAVLGQPIAHSLSPLLHRAAYAALGLNSWTYEAIECDESQLAGLVAASGDDVVGYSCTMPLKRTVLQVADAVSEKAAAIGAGNTLLRVDQDWYADNTDWIGIQNSLAEKGISARGNVVLLGAGGTAQAALAALTEAETVTVLVREPARALALRDTADRLDVPVAVVRLDGGDSEDAWLRQADLIISTLPAGAADPLARRVWSSSQALLDAIYHPWPTQLARAMTEAGASVVGGADLLLHQAARQVELMTGNAAPIPAMRAALPESGLAAEL